MEKQNNFLKIILAVFGACDAVMYIATPIFVGLAVLNLGVLTDLWQIGLLQGIAITSTLFRGIKVGFLKE